MRTASTKRSLTDTISLGATRTALCGLKPDAIPKMREREFKTSPQKIQESVSSFSTYPSARVGLAKKNIIAVGLIL
jgi:hypothetical protein